MKTRLQSCGPSLRSRSLSRTRTQEIAAHAATHQITIAVPFVAVAVQVPTELATALYSPATERNKSAWYPRVTRSLIGPAILVHTSKGSSWCASLNRHVGTERQVIVASEAQQHQRVGTP
eukprot:scaffold61326_cov28-Tisochrysis_lutea.AAC.4